MTDKTILLNEALQAAYKAYPTHEVLLYRHYKGGVYDIVGHTWLTEEQEVGVQYRRVDGPGFSLNENEITFTRPLSSFASKLEDGTPRFQKVRRTQRTEYVPV